MTTVAGDTVQHSVVFQPSGQRGKVAEGTPLRTAARELGVEIESICADKGTCGKCRVLIEEGRHGSIDSSPDHASPMRDSEAEWITKRAKTWKRTGLDPDRLRLSCQARIFGDMIVFVPESSRGNRQIIRKTAGERAIDLKPAVRRYYVELEPATLENPLGDLERLAGGLVEAMDRVNTAAEWKKPDPAELEFSYPVLQHLSRVVREEDWKVSVTVWNDREVVFVQPGFHDDAYGAAVDIGSTAIAVYLCDLLTGEVVATESMMNPQTAIGDDIMTRMTYEAENEEGLQALQSAVIGGINQLLQRAARSARLKVDSIHELAVVGNTTMHHLFLGLTTQNLGTIPYAPTLHRPLDIKARDLQLTVNPGASVHMLPIAASFVGADAMGVILAEEPHRQDENLLIIDVGTNAELILGNRDGLLCTSTPTGPAFEGAHIEYGMRAAVGAIERISIDPETLEPAYDVIGDGKGDGDEDDPTLVKGICGSAIIDGVAELFRVGVVGPRGHFREPVESPRIRKGDLGWEYVVAWEAETSLGRDVPITLNDVRQIQLAKAALYTAAQILLREAGLETPDKILLAGAFGSHIDKEKALILGMIPDCPLDRVYSIGNAAGDGARIALLNRDKRLEAAEVARSIRRIELPVDPDFQREYMMAMNFPHMAHRFPSIEHLVDLAEPDPMAGRFLKEVGG